MNNNSKVFAPRDIRALIERELSDINPEPIPLYLVIRGHYDIAGDCQSYQELRHHVIAHPTSVAPLLVASWDQSSSQDWLRNAATWGDEIRLPVTLAQLRNAITIATERSLTSQQWTTFVDHAFRTHLESQASIVRHSFRGIIAVVRLYIGSLICRASAIDRSEAVFRDLREKARKQDRESEGKQIESLVAEISAYAKWIQDTHVGAEAIRTKRKQRILDRRFLMFDDQVFDHGWNILFQELLQSERSHFEGFGTPFLDSWRNLLASIRRDHKSATTILLDCNLGKKAPTGLKILSSIRRAYPEMPIVFLTAYDDAELALWALRAGATRFFAKQLHDASDRSSEAYFDHFLCELDVGEFFEPIRKLYAKYAAVRGEMRFSDEYSRLPRMEFELGSDGGALRSAREFFDCAFYLLFSYADGFRHWGLWAQGAEDIGGALVGQVLLCIDQALPRRRKATRESRHHARVEQSQVRIDSVLALLGNRLSDLRGREVDVELPSPRLPDGCLYNEDDLRTDGDTPGIEGNTRSTHEERSARAAVELCRGLASLGSMPVQSTAADVVVIDDRGDNGWFSAFTGRWSDCRTFKSVEGILNDVELQKSNCMVLNLHMPDLDDGLEALRLIKQRAPGLPILVATATTDAPGVLKAMRTGAVDFIAKSLSRPLSNEECLKYAESVSNKVEAARVLGASRSRKWLDRSSDWLLRRTPVSQASSQTMDKINREADRRSADGMFDFPANLNWKEAISDALRLFAHTYYQWRLTKVSMAYENRVLVPLDAWRIEWFMPTEDETVLRRLIMTASQIVEELGQMVWALEAGRSFRRSNWGASDAWRQDAWLDSRATTNAIRITDALRKLSPDAMGIWERRIKGGGTPDEVAVALWNVVSRFEERLR